MKTAWFAKLALYASSPVEELPDFDIWSMDQIPAYWGHSAMFAYTH